MTASDTVTLDNLRDKLPTWHPDDESHLYAVIDIGRFVNISFPQTVHLG
jgi:retrograde regulation protein 2